ncbi:lipoprotein [Streptomyces albiaxialis]|uniref:Lipoprotein n=1 Tax=Streptomyces albiaxialis TaxID=329523 RepID=A0ABN2VH87_9ACTN
MSSSLRRGTLAATTLALAVATLTACGAGNDAQTLEIKPDNAAKTVGDIKIQNVNIVTEAEGSGPATVTGRIFNDGAKDQTLKAVTVGSAGRAELSPAKGEKTLTVPAGGSLALGGKQNAAALLTDSKAAGVRDGNAHAVVFDLSTTGAVKMRATVVPAKHGYDKVGPSAGPSIPEGTGSPSESASPGAGEEGQGGEGVREGERDPNASPDEKGRDGAHASASPGAQSSERADTSSPSQGAHAGH